VEICAQLVVSDKGFVAFYPMRKQQEVYLAMKKFVKEVGAPDVLVCDPHPAQIKREVREFRTQIGTTLKVLEAETQWANCAELYIGLMKEATRKDMRFSGSPLVLWDYCMERRALIFQITAKKLFQLNGTNPHTSTLVLRLTSPTSASMASTSGYIIKTSRHLFLTKRSS